MFPDKVAKTMALTETSFGLGLMIGPALGSLLFEAGGFKLPFFVVGGFACVVALILPIALARVEATPPPSDDDKVRFCVQAPPLLQLSSLGLGWVIKVLTVLICCCLPPSSS